MPTYVYETVPAAGEAAERFEVRQGMTEAPLTAHPASGVPVRRVVVGGLATFTQGAGGGGEMACGMPRAPMPAGGCGSGCGCVM